MDVKEVHTRANQHQRERIIDIKMPSQSYAPRTSTSQPYTPRTSTSTRQDLRRHVDVSYMEPTSSLRRSPVPSHFRSTSPSHFRSASPSRVIPISVTGWAANQSPAHRRDMVAFAKASQAASAASSASNPAAQSADKKSQDVQKQVTEERSVRTRDVPQYSAEDTFIPITSPTAAVQKQVTEERSVRTREVSQHSAEDTFIPITSPTADPRSVRVVSPPMMGLGKNTEENRKMEEREEVSQHSAEDTFSPTTSPTTDPRSVRVVSPPMMSLGKNTGEDREMEETDAGPTKMEVNVLGMSKMSEREVEREERDDAYGSKSTEKKVLDLVSMEDIIEKVMRPAGLGAKVSASGDPSITYHVEKTEQEDGTIQTQIILESKVEEELDLSQDGALEELLSQGVKKVSLEDIKGTPTGSMIENLLSLGLGGDLANKSVNVEIIEEPMDSLSDEDYEDEYEEVSSPSKFSQPSAFFQIEELENVPHDSERHESGADVMKTSETSGGRYSSVRVQEDESRDTGSPYFSLDQDPQEYFVSTPDDNVSDAEEGGIASYGHYGVVDDLSDERYYQEEGPSADKMFGGDESGGYQFVTGDHSFVRESFPEIIEEEIHVSPTVQKSMLGPQDLAVDVTKVQQSSDNGTVTIVAELNVSQNLEDSGGAAGWGDRMRASGDQDITGGEGFTASGESVTEVTEKHIKLGPSEKSFTFQMDVNNGQAQGSSWAEGGQVTRERSEFGQVLQSQTTDPPLKVIHEKKVATVYLDSSNDQ